MRKLGSIRLIVTVLVAIAIALFLPGLGMAGSLEPSGPPDSTMKTLDQIPPTWSLKLRADDGPNGDSCNSSRFKCIFHNEAVLDKETGLVWEKSPSTALVGQYDAYNHCNNLTTGGRLGWRLPTAQELASLLDPAQSNPALPLGHPFSNVQLQSQYYWSASTETLYYRDPVSGLFSSSTAVWFVDFTGGYVTNRDMPRQAFVWCVRGAHSTDLHIY